MKFTIYPIHPLPGKQLLYFKLKNTRKILFKEARYGLKVLIIHNDLNYF